MTESTDGKLIDSLQDEILRLKDKAKKYTPETVADSIIEMRIAISLVKIRNGLMAR
ncbi:MAG: hypothetical protein IIC67_05295 [Thaumarchaeota archaeon]|nr:hypothetical protein [Nitrososphaerota archaeon]